MDWQCFAGRCSPGPRNSSVSALQIEGSVQQPVSWDAYETRSWYGAAEMSMSPYNAGKDGCHLIPGVGLKRLVDAGMLVAAAQALRSMECYQMQHGLSIAILTRRLLARYAHTKSHAYDLPAGLVVAWRDWKSAYALEAKAATELAVAS